MKLNRVLASCVALFLLWGCSQPIGTSLLSAGSSSSTITTTTEETGDLAIQADNDTMSVLIDNSDKIEITGTCKDLNRKKNRILVEVFAGEDETVTPYISNAISDKCQTIDSGLPLTDKCFWVTKGIGLIEDAGLPTERTFPQCHDGRFSFAIKLGQILVNSTPGLANLKYTVRFKLRTLEGILSDTAWSRVTVDRNLGTPTIDTIEADTTNFACTLGMSPARFNQNILYSLSRSYTDSASSTGVSTLFTGSNSGLITTNDSVYSWKDNNYSTTHALFPTVYGVLSGVKYSYTLTATENQYVYSTIPTQASNVATCELPAPTVNATVAPTANTCYVTMQGNINPAITLGTVTTQWGLSTTTGWTGTDGSGATFTDITSSCNPSFMPTACTISGLAAATTYYIAVRERGYAQTGKWSNILTCRTP